MLLIADSGSSKTDWRLIDNETVKQYECKGLNPDFHSAESISTEVSTVFSKDLARKISVIQFYGSGSSSDTRKDLVRKGLVMVFVNAEINIHHDLLGAARAACGKEGGLAGILGTGSNCCLFDGQFITKEFRSGGYVIGDEGGGVDIGKKVIKSFIEEGLPADLKERFDFRYKYSVDDLLEQVYKKPQPNRFLASFSQFAFHNKEHPFISELISNSFRSYFENQVLRHKEAKELPLNLVGSIAFYYQEFIRIIAKENGVRIGNILEKPISGLTLYHTSLSN